MNKIIKEICTASNDTIVVVLEFDFGYENDIVDMEGWTVNGTVPISIHRYSYPYDQKEKNNNETPIKMHHKIYLIIGDDLRNGGEYNINTPYGIQSFVFNDFDIRCESLKVNQVGYNKKSRIRYANFGVFMGDGGTKVLPDNISYSVFDLEKNVTVHTGDLQYWGYDYGETYKSHYSGEHVYRIDLSTLDEGGPYKIIVHGIGSSYTFGVGDKYSELLARTYMRGLYHQRCGIALEYPHTTFIRGSCHHDVYETDVPWGPSTFITVDPEKHKKIHTFGGYHDAGDYDIRPMHTLIPLLLLSTYDCFKENFIDRQYNIPESGNGIPDFLDEAMWGIYIWEQLQLNSTNCTDPEKYGAVRMGIEANGHPGYGRDRADSDKRLYGTFDIGMSITLDTCGLLAHASRLLKPFNKSRSDELLDKALLSWGYISKNDPMVEPIRYMYASLQMYLCTATGDDIIDYDNQYHIIFRSLAQTYIIENSGSWPHTYMAGNNSSRCKASHFISYMVTEYATDGNIKNGIYNRMKHYVLNGDYMGWNTDYAYPQGVTKFMGWGTSTAQGIYAETPMFLYRIETDQDMKNKCYDMVSILSDFAVGLNPLSKCFVTGLGHDTVQSPLHLDSWYTKYGKGIDGRSMPVAGNVPGILVYGPSDGRSGLSYQRIVTDKIYPSWDNLAGLRRWSDGWSAINLNEFTTWETIVWNAIMTSFLYNANETQFIPTPDEPLDWPKPPVPPSDTFRSKYNRPYTLPNYYPEYSFSGSNIYSGGINITGSLMYSFDIPYMVRMSGVEVFVLNTRNNYRPLVAHIYETTDVYKTNQSWKHIRESLVKDDIVSMGPTTIKFKYPVELNPNKQYMLILTYKGSGDIFSIMRHQTTFNMVGICNRTSYVSDFFPEDIVTDMNVGTILPIEMGIVSNVDRAFFRIVFEENTIPSPL